MKRFLWGLIALCLLCLTACQGMTAPTPEPAAAAPEEKHLSVPLLCQYPELPTGCESTAAAMVLQYYGDTVTPTTFAADWLPRSEAFYTKNGVQHGPDPARFFAGDPFSAYAYGCFAPVIVTAVQEHSTRCTAFAVTGHTLAQLCREYLDRDKPLLIWATMGMQPKKQGNRWQLPDGSSFTWPAGEHCLVLVGYTADSYCFNDPQTGAVVRYAKALCETRFTELGQQAVCIESSTGQTDG